MPRGPLIVDLDGLTITPEERILLQNPAVGGVIYFAKNYDNPEQLLALSQSIKALRPELLITVDQEGGRVQRFKQGLTRLPSMAELVSHQSPALIQAVATIMAMEMRALGVEMSFSPVLDCDYGQNEVIASRAFGQTPATVAEQAGYYYRAMQAVGMPATGKHFPGHGAVNEDSHLAAAVDHRPLAEIEADQYPFKHLIAAGLQSMMTAHITYTAIEDKPATFSAYWLKTVLRERLNFEGVVFSDDLTMAGAAVIGDYPSRATAALAAGCDFIFACHNRPAIEMILQHLELTAEDSQQRRDRFEVPTIDYRWADLAQNTTYQAANAVYTHFFPTRRDEKTI